MSAADEQKIAELEALLDAGVTQTTVDGVSTSIDLDVVATRLAALKRRAWADRTGRRPHPVFSQPMRLGGRGC
jgi:hypothetical protein